MRKKFLAAAAAAVSAGLVLFPASGALADGSYPDALMFQLLDGETGEPLSAGAFEVEGCGGFLVPHLGGVRYECGLTTAETISTGMSVDNLGNNVAKLEVAEDVYTPGYRGMLLNLSAAPLAPWWVYEKQPEAVPSVRMPFSVNLPFYSRPNYFWDYNNDEKYTYKPNAFPPGHLDYAFVSDIDCAAEQGGSAVNAAVRVTQTGVQDGYKSSDPVYVYAVKCAPTPAVNQNWIHGSTDINTAFYVSNDGSVYDYIAAKTSASSEGYITVEPDAPEVQLPAARTFVAGKRHEEIPRIETYGVEDLPKKVAVAPIYNTKVAGVTTGGGGTPVQTEKPGPVKPVTPQSGDPVPPGLAATGTVSPEQTQGFAAVAACIGALMLAAAVLRRRGKTVL